MTRATPALSSFANLVAFHLRDNAPDLSKVEWADPAVHPDAAAETMRGLALVGVESLEFEQKSDPAHQGGWLIARLADGQRVRARSVDEGSEADAALRRRFFGWAHGNRLILAATDDGSWRFARRPAAAAARPLSTLAKTPGPDASFDRSSCSGLFAHLASNALSQLATQLDGEPRAKARELAGLPAEEAFDADALFPARLADAAQALAQRRESVSTPVFGSDASSAGSPKLA
jgi:hypothetical protein